MAKPKVKNVIRARSEIKLRAHDNSKVTYVFEKGVDPFDVAKCMLQIHAANVGIVKMHNDTKEFFDAYVQHLKDSQNKQEHFSSQNSTETH